MTSTAALVVKALRAGYGRHTVLEEINLAVNYGEWCALLGPNASGKTTLLHCVGGMLVPVAGAIEICSRPLKSDARGASNSRGAADARSAKEKLGFASAPDRLPGLLTGRQCLEVYAAAKGLRAIDADVLRLAEEFRFTPMLDVFVDTCSLGTRQKLAVLCGLLGEPGLIVLDEAFNGLDPASALVLKKHLRARVTDGRCAVLLATHDLDIVEHYADRAALILNGRIAHEWGKENLSALRAASWEGFEAALAAVAVKAP
jgi:ABC-2 type transport system ATP-binding protein